MHVHVYIYTLQNTNLYSAFNINKELLCTMRTRKSRLYIYMYVEIYICWLNVSSVFAAKFCVVRKLLTKIS